MSDQDKEVFHAALRQDLGVFIEKSFQQIIGKEKFKPNWHLDALAHKLMAVERGEIRRLIVSLPPRTLKSNSASVAFPAWVHGRNPNKKIMGVSYGTELACQFLRESREIMKSGWYRETFPDTVLRPAKQTESEFHTTVHGSRYAASVGGALTGLGADLIIVDDPIKAAEGASSPTARQAVKDWFANTLVSRLNDQASGAIVVVMQRLHIDDLVGHLLDKGGWDHLSIPAEAPTTLHYRIDRIGSEGEKVHVFEAGSLLDPVHLPKGDLERLRHDMGAKVYSAQYLQTPLPDGGAVFDWKSFKFFDNKGSEKPLFDFVFQSWDVASSTSATADYSVCTTWGVVRTDEFYLIDVVRVKMTCPQLLERAKSLHDKYAPDLIVVEAVGLGLPFYQTLAGVFHKRVVCDNPAGDKASRAELQAIHVEEGRVFVPREAPWLDEFRKEIIAFPSGKRDDQVDSMVQFLRCSSTMIARAQLLGRRHHTDREFEIKPPGAIVTVTLVGARRLRPFNSLFHG